MKTRVASGILFAGILSCFFSSAAFADITFVYDNAGNRISREIVLDTRSSLGNDSIPPTREITLADNFIKIYPDPSRGVLKIVLPDSSGIDTYRFSIYSVSGQVLMHELPQDIITELDLSSQPDGVYVLVVDDGQKKESFKILKK